MNRKVPFFYLLILLAVNTATVIYFYQHPVKVTEKVIESGNQPLSVYSQNQFTLTKPFLAMDLLGEDSSFSDLKESIQRYIKDEKADGKLETASVYVRIFAGRKWFSLNPDIQYNPGSVMKLVTLLTYLRESQNNPSILEKKINFQKHFDEKIVQTIVSHPLKPGMTYTVKELLSSMIMDSDNDATVLLNNNINTELYFNLLKNLNLELPKANQIDYPLTVTQCSLFFRILYSSSYLTPEMSEYALNLLTKSDFKGGITHLLPTDIKVAHKFGERNTPTSFQLHETGIVYFDNTPYLITVMTKGNDQNKLSTVIGNVSSMVYDYMKNLKS